MDNRIKYSFKQKLASVRAVLKGYQSMRSVARGIGSDEKTIRRWLRIYQQHGEPGLKFRSGSYSGEFKVRVIQHMLKNHLTLLEAATTFGIPNDSTVCNWLRIYESRGSGGLLKETRGRKKLMKAKPPKKIKEVSSADAQLAALQAENEYLRAENAYLKKLKALIQEEEAAKARNKQQKPSKD